MSETVPSDFTKVKNTKAKHNKTPRLVFNSDKNRQSSLFTVFWRSAVYEGKFLWHNSWDYLMLLWLPLLTITSIWWIFSQPYIVDLPIGVIDNSKSSYSRTLTRYLEASPDLTIHRHYHNTQHAKQAILEQKIYGVVIIPEDFTDDINKGMPSPVILKVNAQYGTHSGILQRGVQGVVGTFSAGVEIKRNVKQGQYPNQAQINYSPIGIERISLFNIGANYQQFLASTVIPALLHILIMIIGATTVGREIRDKTFSLWYHNIVYSDMPYPDFKALKHLPPDEKLAYLHSQLDDSWRHPVNYDALTIATYDFKPNTQPKSANVEATLPSLPSEQQLEPSDMSLPQQSAIQYPFDTIYDPNYNKTIKPRMPTSVSILALIIGLNGKLIWALLFYMLWGVAMITLSVSVHPASGAAMLLVFVAYVAMTMISLWMGAIFTLTNFSLRMGLSTTAFISAPSFAFAGVTFPLIAMSEGAQRWANMLPLTHYLKVHLSQLQMMAPPSLFMPTVLGLIFTVFVMLVITALLSIRAFKHPDRWGAR